jgi:hypothetical protein
VVEKDFIGILWHDFFFEISFVFYSNAIPQLVITNKLITVIVSLNFMRC